MVDASKTVMAAKLYIELLTNDDLTVGVSVVGLSVCLSMLSLEIFCDGCVACLYHTM
jgi:hypothetical protein